MKNQVSKTVTISNSLFLKLLSVAFLIIILPNSMGVWLFKISLAFLVWYASYYLFQLFHLEVKKLPNTDSVVSGITYYVSIIIFCLILLIPIAVFFV